MKKLVLGSAILAVLGMASTAMAANSGTVNFTGAVTTATCDLSVQDGAGANISSVDLGTLMNNSTADGTAVSFKLVPQDAACLAKNNATMNWTSPTLTATGFGNSAPNGTNAYMIMSTSNSTATSSAGRIIKQGQTAFDYTTATGGIQSFDFAAQLKRPVTGTMTPGAFAASASYTVAYK
ncbi:MULTISPECIES: fimbrial protein [unclassified Escherichia]|uniref:fimbrial protein n=1 Tax=unclassified Escherichia TaxID=2608889 RepID=UPI000CF6EBE3|nr:MULTISPECIES: fimbrial protein [unclassified Escherichia]